MKDGLTGLYNRLGYLELAHSLYRDISSRGKQLAILFLDMDRLKHMNDVYGHSTGDLAIRCAARAIQESLPETPGISCGYVFTDPENSRTLDELAAEADHRMYQEKRKQRL